MVNIRRSKLGSQRGSQNKKIQPQKLLRIFTTAQVEKSESSALKVNFGKNIVAFKNRKIRKALDDNQASFLLEKITISQARP